MDVKCSGVVAYSEVRGPAGAPLLSLCSSRGWVLPSREEGVAMPAGEPQTPVEVFFLKERESFS
jgi:hypothetical protein